MPRTRAATTTVRPRRPRPGRVPLAAGLVMLLAVTTVALTGTDAGPFLPGRPAPASEGISARHPVD